MMDSLKAENKRLFYEFSLKFVLFCAKQISVANAVSVSDIFRCALI